MNTIYHRSLSAVAALAAAAVFAGCATQTDSVSQDLGIENYADEVLVAERQLDRTIESLENLSDATEMELQPQFNLFATNLAQLQAATYEVVSAANAMEIRGRNYFSNWDVELARIQNEDIREASAERRETVLETYSRTSTLYSRTAERLSSLVADLEDVHAHLDADLSMAGLDAIGHSIDEILDNSESVDRMLSVLDSRFEAIGVDYPTGVAADLDTL